jgi:methylamine dehydrogenase heavy chain
MTPAQSVSVVDVVDREFAGEISTPGCAIIMPTGDRAFMMICGDGSLQYIELDANGAETGRERSKAFFSVEDDAVFDKPVLTDRGWARLNRSRIAASQQYWVHPTRTEGHLDAVLR